MGYFLIEINTATADYGFKDEIYDSLNPTFSGIWSATESSKNFIRIESDES